MSKEKVIELTGISVKHATVFIEGDGDLCLNKMNARSTRTLTSERKDKKTVREVPNVWEDLLTAIHWERPIVQKNPGEYTQEDWANEMKTNRPCITAFGLKKSFGQAVVRNNIDKYATKLDNAINIVAVGGMVPIDFTDVTVDEKLMSPQRGAPVLVHLNRFSGWKAQFEISYTENVYSLEQIVNIINMAGFGIGIGSGRTSGYGRYHVTDVK